MSLPNPSQFTRILASHITSLKNHLEGAVGSTAPWHFRQSTGNFQVTLADAAGATQFRLNDSAGVDIFHIDSDGNVTFGGTVTLSSFTFPLSASPAPTSDGLALWDTDDNVLAIGDGAATKLLIPDAQTTIGDIQYASAAKTKARLGIGTAGQYLRVNPGATAPEWTSAATYKYKTAAQTVSASTTFVDVAASSGSFAFTPEANGVYLVTCQLNMTFTGTGGVKFQFTGPASPTRVDINTLVSVQTKENGAGGNLAPNPILAGEANLSAAFSSAFGAHNAAASTYPLWNSDAPPFGTASYPVYITAVIANGSTSSAVTLQIAQNSANGTCVSGIGSWFKAEKIS